MWSLVVPVIGGETGARCGAACNSRGKVARVERCFDYAGMNVMGCNAGYPTGMQRAGAITMCDGLRDESCGRLNAQQLLPQL